MEDDYEYDSKKDEVAGYVLSRSEGKWLTVMNKLFKIY
jgi:hypothetical protein